MVATMAKIDDSVKKKVPELRFDGFTDDWEERKLGDTLIELKSGLSRMLSNNDIGLPVVRANNINDGQFNIDSDVKYWYVNDPQGANTVNYLIRKNDILINFINSEAKMGTATIVENTPIRDTIYTTNILRARLKKEYDSYYWFALTQINQYKINIKIITKPAVNQASFTTVDFKKLNFMFPNLKEQQRIGSFFKQLDDTIALHQRKLDLLKEQKKGYLQKMFPKNGAKVPELRFAGFADDWEERNLGEWSDVRDGTHASPKYIKQGHPMVTSKNLTDSGLDMSDVSYLTDEDFNEINQRSKVDIGDILFGMIGTIGKPVIVDRDDFAIKNVALIKEKTSPEIINTWLIQYLKSPSFERFIQKENAGGTQKFIALGLIRDMKLMTPSVQEQARIGELLNHLDNLIVANQRKLDLLKEQKKGYLQKMFA